MGKTALSLQEKMDAKECFGKTLDIKK